MRLGISTYFAFYFSSILILLLPQKLVAQDSYIQSEDPCYAKEVQPGTKCTGGGVYAGEYLKKKYMVTAGNCSDSPFPICDNTVDTTVKRWGVYSSFSGISDKDNGQFNSKILVEKFKDTEAAKYCEQMNWGGYSDWFLPSENELLLLKANAQQIGSFSWKDWYWTSTEGDWTPNSNYRPQIARVVRFDWGASNLTKSENLLVRCVRLIDPKVLPKPLPTQYKLKKSENTRGTVFYKDDIQKFISISYSFENKKIVVKVLDTNLKILADVLTQDSTFSITSHEREYQVLTSPLAPGKVVVVSKNPRPDVPYNPEGFVDDYEYTASVIDYQRNQLAGHFNIKGNGYGQIYLFRDLILTEENRYKESYFKAYLLDGKLVKELTVKNDSSRRFAKLVLDPSGSTLNLKEFESASGSAVYYDFFTGQKKFTIPFYDQSQFITKNENLFLNWDDKLKTFEVWSQLNGKKIGVINANYSIYETLRPVISSEFGLISLSEASVEYNNYVSVADNIVHIFDLLTTKEIAVVKCKCIPMSLMRDQEDGRIKLVSLTSGQKEIVVDVLSGKVEYTYNSLISYDYRNRLYLGFGRFLDFNQNVNSSKAFNYVYNSKTNSIDYTSAVGDWGKKVVYLSENAFVVYDSEISLYESE